MNWLKRIKNDFVILIVAVGAFWQISFLQNSVKWDMLDVVLPWRYHVGECIQNGEFPFWNPYQQVGYPIHADLQCPVWFPETWLTGGITGYSNYTLHFFLILYLFLAGLGMYRFALHFGIKKNVALLTGICYMLSGFFIGHAQALFAVIAGAFLPFVLLSWFQMLSRLTYLAAIKTALFMFLMVTGGYPAITIILIYFLAVLFIFFAVQQILSREYKKLWRFFILNLFAAALVLLFCLPLIISMIQVSGYTERYAGILLRVALEGPFSPQSLLSFIAPFSTVKNPEFFKTDISMRNAFMSLFMFIFFIYSLFRKQQKIHKTILFFGLFCLLASFGDYTFFREFLYRYFPLMNIFRFPSYFTLFTILCFLLIAGQQLSSMMDEEPDKKLFLKIVSGFILFLVVMIVLSVYRITGTGFTLFRSHRDFFSLLENTTFYEHLLIHSCIQLILISAGTYIILKSFHFKTAVNKLFFLIIAEMIISVQLTIYYTAVSEINPKILHRELKKKPAGFPLPDEKYIVFNSDSSSAFYYINRNCNIFRKKISSDGFSSFWFNDSKYIYDSLLVLKDNVLNNPPVYLSDQLYSYKQIPHKLKHYKTKQLFTDEKTVRKYLSSNFKHGKNDTCHIRSFSPNRIITEVSCQKPQILTLLQSNYTGWKVFVDNHPVSHFTTNYIFISAVIPEGKHIVEFRYSNPAVKAGFFISYTCIFLLLLWLLLRFVLSDIKKRWLLLLIPLVFILLLIFYFPGTKKRYYYNHFDKQSSEINNTIKKWKSKYNSPMDFVVNTCQYDLPCFKNEKHWFKKDLHFSSYLSQLADRINSSSGNYFAFGNLYRDLPNEVQALLRLKYPYIADRKETENGGLVLFTKLKNKNKAFLFTSRFDCENNSPEWKVGLLREDTTFTVNGNKSFKLDWYFVYSPTFISKFKDVSSSDTCFINISLDVFLDNGATADLVFEHSRNKKIIQWAGRSLHHSVNSYNRWETIYCTHLIKGTIHPDDLIKIYVWNTGKTGIYIDNFNIMVTPYIYALY